MIKSSGKQKITHYIIPTIITAAAGRVYESTVAAVPTAYPPTDPTLANTTVFAAAPAATAPDTVFAAAPAAIAPDTGSGIFVVVSSAKHFQENN